MKLHKPHHWIAVAVVLAATLFAVNQAWGGSTGAAAVFEGRPAMSGAQAGQGPMAGPPQGGISPQGTDGGGGVNLRPPAAIAGASGGSVPRDPGMTPINPTTDRSAAPQRDRDDGAVSKQGRASDKAKKAATRVVRKERRVE
jgi:hypothetical protein